MAKNKIEFDQEQDGVKYTVLDVPYAQRKEVRSAAEELGQPKIVEFNKDASEWRLIGDLVPKGVTGKKLDEVFAQWKTPEAAAAVAVEREAFEARKEAKITLEQDKPVIDPARLYYPVANEKGERPEWTAAIAALKDQGTKVIYEGKVGAFVHHEGPTTGLESFQTPEAKDAWDSRGRESTARSDARREQAGSSIEAQAFEAKGEFLMAASVKGLLVPSKETHVEERDATMKLIKNAPDTEVSAAFQVTEVEKKRLEAKLYYIQVSVVEKDAAAKKGSDLMPEESKNIRKDFGDLDAGKRREAANFIGLDANEFGRLVAVRSGFFALRDEMIDRGLLETKEKARESKQQESKEPEKAAEKAGTSAAREPKKSQSAGLAQALANGGHGR